MAAAGVPWLGEASYPENLLIFGMDANACSNSRRAMRVQWPETGHEVYTTMMLWNREAEFVAWQGSTHPVEDIGGHEQCPENRGNCGRRSSRGVTMITCERIAPPPVVI